MTWPVVFNVKMPSISEVAEYPIMKFQGKETGRELTGDKRSPDSSFHRAGPSHMKGIFQIVAANITICICFNVALANSALNFNLFWIASHKNILIICGP